MRRLLLVPIDAEETECGECHLQNAWALCVQFQKDRERSNGGYCRLPECLEAERAAKGVSQNELTGNGTDMGEL